MHNYFFPSRYESPEVLKSYIRSQYGFFLKENPYTLSEDFYKKIISESAPYLNPSSLALDVGCATGRLVFEYEKIGVKKAFGVDSSKLFIDFCNLVKSGKKVTDFHTVRTSKAEFVRSDVLDLKFKIEPMDFISCINVIDRVSNPQGLVDALYTILKPGGILLLVDPYDWEMSPAPKKSHVRDMRFLLEGSRWGIEKEVRNIEYVVPISSSENKRYLCHLIIART